MSEMASIRFSFSYALLDKSNVKLHEVSFLFSVEDTDLHVKGMGCHVSVS